MRTRLHISPALCIAGSAFLAARGDGPADRYVFVPDVSGYVRIELHGWQTGSPDLGRLDAAGNFIAAPQEEAQRVIYGQGGAVWRKIPVINEPAAGAESEPVYEFRSGLLIKGQLKKGEGFTPEVESRIFPFQDYHFHPSAIRIYNLPGRFVPKSDAPPKK